MTTLSTLKALAARLRETGAFMPECPQRDRTFADAAAVDEAVRIIEAAKAVSLGRHSGVPEWDEVNVAELDALDAALAAAERKT